MVYKIVAISGSLHKSSVHTGLLKACIELKNSDLQIEIIDISQFPHLNQDLLETGKFPPVVQAARERVEKADAVLFAIPENNYLVSAPLKNAYDWISMSLNPAEKPSPLAGKIAGMLSAGAAGGKQAQ
jgi:chromate reductase